MVKTIYVFPSSHWNLGDSSDERGGTFAYHFVVPPEVVKVDAKAHIDKVLDACLAHDYLYWTIEALWMYEAWWDNTPEKDRREKMLQLIRGGRITVSAPSHQYRSAFLNGEAINRTIYDAARWRREYQLPLDTAIMNDVPGWNWSLVQPLKKSGVNYFVAGPNNFIGGALSLAPKDIPFWWEGPDGSRILTWVCIGNYTEGQTRVYINPSAGRFFAGMGYSMPGVSLNMQEAEIKKVQSMNDEDLMEYNIGLEMERLRKENYPFDAILVQYSHDSIGPDNIIGTMKYINAWNAKHKYPQIVLGSPRQFFEYLLTKYGPGAFPTFSGDWAGLWETTSFPNPEVRAQLRYAAEHAPILEIFSSIAQLMGSRPYPWSEMQRINALVLENADQGMPNGLAAPLANFQSIRGLHSATLSVFVKDVATSAPSVVVFNAASVKRTDAVNSALLRNLTEGNRGLFDAVTGKEIPWRRVGEKRMEFVAPDVPALGYKVFYAAEKPSQSQPESTVSAPDSSTIENEFYRVSVDPISGKVKSILDKEANREIVDNASTFSLSGLCDSDRGLWGGINPTPPVSAQLTQNTEGGIARLIIERKNSPFSHTEIALHSGIKRVDISNRFSTESGAPLANGYYVSFPFALSKNALVPRVENANAFLIPGGPGVKPTYLSGAYTGAFIATRAAAVHEGTTFGIALAQRQSECVLFDSITSTLFVKIFTPEGGVNPTDTEFPREFQFDFAITSYSGAFDPVRVKDFSQAFAQPLWGDWREASGKPGELFKAPGGPLKQSQWSFLEINAPNVKLSAWKRVEQGDSDEFLLRFQEVGGVDKTPVVVKSKFTMSEARLTNMIEEPLEGRAPLPTGPLAFSISANETVSIRARFVGFDRSSRER